jgi:uncharacterized protein
MNYVIDGYNLIGKLTVTSLKHAEKEETLIKWLASRQGKHHFTLFFDGKGDLNTLGSKYQDSGIDVIYTANGETADERIIFFVKHSNYKDNMCIVSSDRELIRYAKTVRAKSMTSEVFIRKFKSLSDKTSVEEAPPVEIDFWLRQFDT